MPSTPTRGTPLSPPMTPKTPGPVDRTEDVSTLLFHKRPIATLYYSLIVVKDFLSNTTLAILRHWVFQFIVVPVALLWTVLAQIEGPHSYAVGEATTNLQFVVWWFSLGVLSSVGLGSGMHTGLLFTFPHIFKVIYSAEHCHTTDFDTRINMWGKLPATTLEFPCEVQPEGTPLPTFWELYWKVLAAAIIWGVGTAAGEIPPYQFSYLAAVAGEANAELAAELEETKNSDDMSLPYSVRKFNAMKAWMVDFIERHGFWGVYLMSAWPNAAFDLCGMCCGSFKMPFWTFFGGTVLGKGFTLRPIQCAIFVGIFSQQYRGAVVTMIGNVVPIYGETLSVKANDYINSFIGSLTEDADDSGDGEGGIFKMLWGLLITCMVLGFIKSAMENFAQQYLREKIEEASKAKRQ